MYIDGISILFKTFPEIGLVKQIARLPSSSTVFKLFLTKNIRFFSNIFILSKIYIFLNLDCYKYLSSSPSFRNSRFKLKKKKLFWHVETSHEFMDSTTSQDEEDASTEQEGMQDSDESL